MLQNYSTWRVKKLRHSYPISCQSSIINRELLSGIIDFLVFLGSLIGKGRMFSVDFRKSLEHRDADPDSEKPSATYWEDMVWRTWTDTGSKCNTHCGNIHMSFQTIYIQPCTIPETITQSLFYPWMPWTVN